MQFLVFLTHQGMSDLYRLSVGVLKMPCYKDSIAGDNGFNQPKQKYIPLHVGLFIYMYMFCLYTIQIHLQVHLSLTSLSISANFWTSIRFTSPHWVQVILADPLFVKNILGFMTVSLALLLSGLDSGSWGHYILGEFSAYPVNDALIPCKFYRILSITPKFS